MGELTDEEVRAGVTDPAARIGSHFSVIPLYCAGCKRHASQQIVTGVVCERASFWLCDACYTLICSGRTNG